ncbi:MAG: TRAP transporter permease [Eubacteriales bacterium]|nr:TRAP transporter permease [Eubacteriales bacterium]
MSIFKRKKGDKAGPNMHENLLKDVDTTGMTEDQIAALEAEAVLQKYDRESSYRNRLSKPLTLFTAIILIAFSVFQLYTSIFTIPTQLLRAYHLSFVLFLVYLLFPAKKGMRKDMIPWYDWALALLSLIMVLYIPLNFEHLVKNIGNYGITEVVIGIVGILLVMEACRRVVGMPILIIVSCFLLYTLFGSYIPGSFGHRGYTLKQLSTHMFFTMEGVFGTPLGVSSTFIFLFILFGAFLEKTGVGKLFIDLANAIAGKRAGGPAKVAVISSALQGTVSGSSVANTVGTGSFTIPAMKRLGYKPEFAGAVEAAASTGGQIMPPIMGAAAFLMAEVTGISYGRIVLSAIIPAVLYFSGILISVHHEARKLGLRGMPDEEIPKFKLIMKERGFLLLPLIFMIYILSSGLTPTYAALGAILTSLMAYSIQFWSLIPAVWIIGGLQFGLPIEWCALGSIAIWMLVCLFRRRLGFDPRDILDSLKNGARNVLSVAVACAMAGMIVGAVTLTGLGLKFATGLAALAGNNIFLMMFFTMLASIVLGMGVPTTANYLITSTICAPAIISMLLTRNGLTEPTLAITMSAHLFVFYFGIIADITPPVALAAMAGSAIAKGEPFKTGVTATRIAIGAFIVPYIFVLNPSMLMIDAAVGDIILNVCTALLGMYALSGGLTGYVQDHCTWYERIALIVGGMGMIIPGWVTDVAGLVIVAAIIIVQKLRVKKQGGESIPKHLA